MRGIISFSAVLQVLTTSNGESYGAKIDDVRIVGGGEANPNSIPWQVALVSSLSDGRRPICGGTILCPNYVITAAHCTRWTQGIASRLHIIAGEHNLDVDMANDKATRHRVEKIIDHNSYKTFPNGVPDYDYSILKLSDPIDLSHASNAKAACLPGPALSFTQGTKFVVSGWGRTVAGNPSSSSRVLHHVSVPWVSDTRCKQSYGSNNITPRMLCAGDITNGNIDACQGDSGGPLTFYDGSRTHLVGVVSWGAGCGVPGRPGVYAETSAVLNWIEQETGSCSDKTNCGKGGNLSSSTQRPSVTSAPCTDVWPLFCQLFQTWCRSNSYLRRIKCRKTCQTC